MKTQMTKIAMRLILIVGLSAGVAKAQIGVGFYTGVETAPGTCEAITSVCYGNTYVLNSYGEWETFHLTLSLDYVDIPNHNGSGIGIIGGSWSLVVYRDNQYFGTLYGRVETGNIIVMIPDSQRKPPQPVPEVSKQVHVTLISTGGLGRFNEKEYENISGVLSAISNLRSRETHATASFNF